MEPRQGPDSKPVEELLSQVYRQLAELKQMVLRQQQVLSTFKIRLLASGRSPPLPMEEGEGLGLFDLIYLGSFRRQDSIEAPRTPAEWSALCAQLAQKRVLSRDDFLAVVLGYAAHVGMYELDPSELFGDVYRPLQNSRTGIAG
ncbi:hypothetical protein Emed_002601 [Eimeria media]